MCTSIDSRKRPNFETIYKEFEKNATELMALENIEKEDIITLIKEHIKLIPNYLS